MTSLEQLKNNLKTYDSLAVAFSGGVDSAFLLAAAREVLGDRVIAITAVTDFFPERESREAVEFCSARGIRQLFVPIRELDNPTIAQNPADRCYLCKKDLFQKIRDLAATQGIYHVAEASNMDDNADYRPGMRAIKELGILSPLREAGFYKKEIRQCSREMGLPTWDKPAYACLASRFVYGETITKKKLTMVEQAEDFLVRLGFRQMRVRIHGTLARIELPPEDMERVFREQMEGRIHETLKELGFSYVTLDLGGFRSGSMNDAISDRGWKDSI